MNNEEFDRVFDETFDEYSSKAPDEYSSDYRPSWKKVKKQIRTIEKRSARKTFFRNLSVIAASMLLGAMIFGGTPVTKAFNPLYQTLKELPGEIATLFFGNQDKTDSDAKTSPPTSETQQSQDLDINETTVITVTLEEAKERVSFELPTFDFIPTNYELNKIDLFFLQGEGISKKVRLTFSNQSNSFWVTLSELGDDTTAGSRSTKAHIEEVQLKYGKGFLTISDDGSSKLEFLKGNIYVIIIGKLQKEELLHFAENI